MPPWRLFIVLFIVPFIASLIGTIGDTLALPWRLFIAPFISPLVGARGASFELNLTRLADELSLFLSSFGNLVVFF